MNIPFLTHIWAQVRSSFWFLPSCLAFSSIIIAITAVTVDKYALVERPIDMWFFYQGSAEGARTVLATLASAMITVAGVIFSITIVALTLATTQLGPRLLKNFIRDTVNQSVLGIFIATFLYCMLVLLAVVGTESFTFIPRFSVTLAILFSILSIGVLIFFIHHVSVSIQADHVIGRVSHTFKKALEEIDSGTNAQTHAAIRSINPHELHQAMDGKTPHTIESSKSGYIQAIDLAGLLHKACSINGIMRMERRAGDFLLPKSILMTLYCKERLTEEAMKNIQECFFFGKERTEEQDVEFALEQIVQIALRALSPGVNDPFTAITCIDLISSTLSLAPEKEIPNGGIFDKDNNLRILTKSINFVGLVDAAFNQIRQAAKDNPAIMIRLLERIHDLLPHCRTADQKQTLLTHAQMIQNNARQYIHQDKDRKDIEERMERIEGEI